ncbi:MAG: hypothetical protein ACI97P_001378 [Arcticibacterium sp.]|jgi:uncharacterized protein YehS (DUF1456 family)
MTNNDILRRLRYAFNYNDEKMEGIFAHAKYRVSKPMIISWLNKDSDEDFKELADVELANFLNGFITEKRGKKDGPLPQPETRLSNNLILKKLKIALNMQSTDMMEVFGLMDVKMSEHELSAFLRNPKQSQYRQLNDQYLRNFLYGLQKKFRG